MAEDYEEEDVEEEDWDDEDEDELDVVFTPTDYGLGSVKVFFHTASPVDIFLQEGETLTSLRERLKAECDRLTYGLAVIVNGQTIASDDEPHCPLRAGSSVVFSGSVKGG